MEYSLFLSAALIIRPCSSTFLDDRVDSSHSIVVVVVVWIVIGIAAITFIASYIFYPAYANNAGGGLGCTATILVGGNSYHTDNILSLIIPAYNEAERLPVMLDVTLKYLDTNRMDVTNLFHSIGNCNDRISKTPMQCEFIIVNDGSTDDTENVIRRYANNVRNGDIVKLISMHKNCGKGGAVKSGMLHSSGQLCLMVDADGATDISDGLPKVLHETTTATTTGIPSQHLPPTAVFGSRAHLEEESTATRSKIRTLLMHSFHFFVKILCSPRIKDTQCGFKLFTRSAAVVLFTNLHLRRWAFDTEIVVIGEKLGVEISEVGVVWHEVDGSKLAIGKLSLLIASLGMLRDMVCVRACYLLGIWRLQRYSKEEVDQYKVAK
ncbi:hypothetical protein ACHAXH_003817 [Discostella pseudostelligera]